MSPVIRFSCYKSRFSKLHILGNWVAGVTYVFLWIYIRLYTYKYYLHIFYKLLCLFLSITYKMDLTLWAIHHTNSYGVLLWPVKFLDSDQCVTFAPLLAFWQANRGLRHHHGQFHSVNMSHTKKRALKFICYGFQIPNEPNTHFVCGSWKQSSLLLLTSKAAVFRVKRVCMHHAEFYKNVPCDFFYSCTIIRS